MRISILLLSIFIINSCNGQEKKQNKEKNTTKTQNNMIEKELDINIIKNLLENQKNVETEENEPEEPYNLSKKDFEIAVKKIVTIAVSENRIPMYTAIPSAKMKCWK